MHGIPPSRLTLALALCKGVGSQTLTRVLMRNSLMNVTTSEFMGLSGPTLVEEYKLTKAAASIWEADRHELVERAAKLEETLTSKGIRVCCSQDALYPAGLEEMLASPPALLFLYGNQKLLGAKTFSVMSSRRSPNVARETVDRLAEYGVMQGEVLIAGHDTPEYQRSAIVPLRWGAPRILVLDMGMFSALGENLEEEPFRSARLWRYKFDPHSDLIVSAINPIWSTHRGANANRDWVIGAIAKRLDFVLIKKGGNMEKIARAALAAGRPVRVSDFTLECHDFQSIGAEIIEQ